MVTWNHLPETCQIPPICDSPDFCAGLTVNAMKYLSYAWLQDARKAQLVPEAFRQLRESALCRRDQIQ